MSRPRRVLGYARVSSEEQARGTSLGDQQEAIRSYASNRGLTVTTLYVEAESAIHEKIERREQMRLLLADIRKGDLVICDKLDRWSRDPAFTHTTVRDILAKGASFYAVSDRCDPSTSEGDTMLGFRVLFAREEHKRIKERMVGTRNLLRNRGWFAAGTPPLGYRRQHPKGFKGAEKNVLIIVPAEAETVRRIFALYLSGMSMARVADELGLKIDRVKDALHNRVYLGEMRNAASDWIRGKHESIVDVDTFVRAQRAIEERRLGGARPRAVASETSTWILRDVARCGRCGAKMTSAYGPLPARLHYYRCRARCMNATSRATNGSYVPVLEVERAFAPLVVARLGELREELAKGHDKPRAVVDHTEKRAKLARRRERYLEAYADETMTRDELRAAMAKLDAELMRLEAEESAANRPDALAEPKVRREMLREMDALAKAWRRARPELRRALVNQLCSAVKLVAGQEPRPVWRSLADLAAAAVRQ